MNQTFSSVLQGTIDNYQPSAILGTRTVNKLGTEIPEVLCIGGASCQKKLLGKIFLY